MDEDIKDPQFIDRYKKEALWRELQASQRQEEQFQQQLSVLQEQRSRAEQSLAAVTSSLETLAGDVEMLLNKTVTIPSEQSLLSKMLLSADSEVNGVLQKIRTHLASVAKEDALDNEDILVKIHTITDQYNKVKAQCDLKQLSLEDAESQLEAARLEALSLAKKLDRERSQTVQRLKPAVVVQQEAPQTPMDVDQPQSTGTAITPEVLNIIKEHEQLKEDSDLAQQLATDREDQLKKALGQVTQLRQQVDKFRLDIQALPDSLLKETGLVKEYEQKLASRSQQVDQFRQITEDLEQQVSSSVEQRQKALDQIEQEQQKKFAQLEADIKKIQSDMNRLRNQRDQFQQQMEVEKVKYSKTDATIQGLKSQNEVSQKRIAVLLEDVKRLKLQLAQASGDELFYKNAVLAFEVSESGDIGSMVSSLQERLEGAINQLQNAQDRLVILEGHKDYSKVLQNALTKLEDAKHKLKEAQSKKSHKGDSAALQAEISSLKQQRDGAFAEVESISNIYTDMEQRYKQQVELVQQKDDEIQKLVIERTKYDQKLLILQKERDGHSNKSIALGRQTAKQQDLIRQYELEDGAKQQLLAALEKELQQQKLIIKAHEQKVRDTQLQISEVQARVDKSAGKYDQVASLLRSKDTEIEAANRKALEAQEENRKLQNKLKHGQRRQSSQLLTGLIDGQDASALKDEVETLRGYKRVAQCSVCQFRLKDVALLKCMHVFCKECIDARIDTRQRKCPTCGVPFSVQEVKQIFI